MWAYLSMRGLQVMAMHSWPLSCTGSMMTGSLVRQILNTWYCFLNNFDDFRGATYWLLWAGWGTFGWEFGPCSLRYSQPLWSQRSCKFWVDLCFCTLTLTTYRLLPSMQTMLRTMTPWLNTWRHYCSKILLSLCQDVVHASYGSFGGIGGTSTPGWWTQFVT